MGKAAFSMPLDNRTTQLQALIEANKDLNAADVNGMTALHQACFTG
jgi:ankyrin repeat protein